MDSPYRSPASVPDPDEEPLPPQEQAPWFTGAIVCGLWILLCSLVIPTALEFAEIGSRHAITLGLLVISGFVTQRHHFFSPRQVRAGVLLAATAAYLVLTAFFRYIDSQLAPDREPFPMILVIALPGILVIGVVLYLPWLLGAMIAIATRPRLPRTPTDGK